MNSLHLSPSFRTLAPILFAAVSAACSGVPSADPASQADEAIGVRRTSPTYGVAVRCIATNNFGYIGTVSGNLTIKSHEWPSGFSVTGSLAVDTKLFGSSDHRRTLAVTGDLDATGQLAFVNPTNTSDELDQLNLAFGPGSMSNLHAKNTTEYQTDCSSSSVTLPHGSDLVLEHTMRVYDRGDGTHGVQIDVSNAGNVPANAASGRVRIGTSTFTGSLHQYFGGTATAPNTVNPQEQGYIEVVVPAATVARCGTYDVAIDLDHTMQSGEPDPFSDDAGQAKTPCLTWTTPIDQFTIGQVPDPITVGKTLGDIVSSKVVARESDKKLCNACHVVGSAHPYSPPPGDIRTGQVIDGQTWAGGWAQAFVMQPDTVKPPYLKALFAQWVQDGAR
jgi:hypothetical protein